MDLRPQCHHQSHGPDLEEMPDLTRGSCLAPVPRGLARLILLAEATPKCLFWCLPTPDPPDGALAAPLTRRLRRQTLPFQALVSHWDTDRFIFPVVCQDVQNLPAPWKPCTDLSPRLTDARCEDALGRSPGMAA